MRARLLFPVFVAALVALSNPLRGAGRAIEGLDGARIIPPPGTVVVDYENVGYQLSVDGDEVVVCVEVGPLKSATPFAPPAGAGRYPVARLAGAITAGARSRYGAVSRVLGWVSRNVAYELDRRLEQDPASVLARRSAYCTGVARLSVALLEAVQIPAREVAGYVASDATQGTVGGYHRWIEVFYPDRGWVFSDPMVSHHYVEATYVRLESTRLDVSQGSEGLLLSRRHRLSATDVYTHAPHGITGRKNFQRQVAGALEIHVAGGGSGTAVLEGGGLRRRQSFVAGASTFLGLAPGSYLLELELASGHHLTRRVDLPGRFRASLYLPESLLALH